MPDINQLKTMRCYFETGITQSYSFRLEQLKNCKKAVLKRGVLELFHAALYQDLKKSPRPWVTETGFLLSEINFTIKHLKAWMQSDQVPTNLLNLPSSSFVLKEPFGHRFNNWPFGIILPQLLFTPLTGAMAAGNCVVLKASARICTSHSCRDERID
jgi:aldehyde dehydrogenase (NAD+)